MYVKKFLWKTQKVQCLNSWGEYQSEPEIPSGHASNMFYRVECVDTKLIEKPGNFQQVGQRQVRDSQSAMRKPVDLTVQMNCGPQQQFAPPQQVDGPPSQQGQPPLQGYPQQTCCPKQGQGYAPQPPGYFPQQVYGPQYPPQQGGGPSIGQISNHGQASNFGNVNNYQNAPQFHNNPTISNSPVFTNNPVFNNAPTYNNTTNYSNK